MIKLSNPLPIFISPDEILEQFVLSRIGEAIANKNLEDEKDNSGEIDVAFEE